MIDLSLRNDIGKTEQITLRLPKELLFKIKALAKENNMSAQKVINQLLEKVFENAEATKNNRT